MCLHPRVRRVLWLVHASAIAVLAMTCAQYLHRPFRNDELDLVLQVHQGVLVHGAPVIPASESLQQLLRADMAYGAWYGLWHPPLYVNLLSAAVAITGSNASMRGVGVLCLLASFAILWRFARAQLGADTPSIVVALPLSLALFSPLVTQGSLLFDIDNTILATLMLLFLWQFAASPHRLKLRRLAWLTLLLALMLLAKVTVLPMVVLACVTWIACDKHPAQNLLALGVIVVVGVAVATAIYLLYCAVFHLPAEWMFRFGFGARRDLVGTTKAISRIALAAGWTLVWTSPVLLVMLAVASVERCVAWWRVRRVAPIDLFLILSLGMYAAYVVVGGMLGKYTMPAALMAATVVGTRIARSWATWRTPSWGLVVAGLVAAAVPASLMPHVLERASAGAHATGILRDPRVMTVAAMCAAAGLSAWIWIRSAPAPARADRIGLAGLAMLVSLAASSPIHTVRTVFADADNGPLYSSREHGFLELAATIRREMPAGRVLISPKDIAWASGPHRYWDLMALAQIEPETIPDYARHQDVWAVVDSTLYPVLTPDVRAQLSIARTEDVGTYRIYVLDHF